jgi:hypothetical protein
MNMASKATSALQQFFGLSNISDNAPDANIAVAAEPECLCRETNQSSHQAISRHCEMMKLCIINVDIDFLDHYLDHLTYLDQRKKRTALVKQQLDNSIVH